MRTEACCQELLKEILPFVDPKKRGACIDVGVGTFAFYCEQFVRLGFQSVAVEPLPSKTLRQLCQRYQIQLIEACLSDIDGKQNLHLGKFAGFLNQNFSSLNPEWFGASTQVKQVESMTLSRLLNKLTISAITCLKLDIEGWEYQVINQFSHLPESLLPKVVMFEYGGGANRQSSRAGWSSSLFSATINSLSVLRDCGYEFILVIDFAPGLQEQIFDLQSEALNLNKIFPANSVYGNVICCRYFPVREIEIAKICASYYDNWATRLAKIALSKIAYQ